MNSVDADNPGSNIERGLIAVGYLLFTISCFLPAMGDEENWASGLEATLYSMGLCIPAIAVAPEAMRSSIRGEDGLSATGIYWGLVWLANLPMLSYLRTRLKVRKRQPITHTGLLIGAACLAGAGHFCKGEDNLPLCAGYYVWFGGIVFVSVSAGLRCILNRANAVGSVGSATATADADS